MIVTGISRLARTASLILFMAGSASAAAGDTIIYRDAQVWTGKGFERRDLAIRDGRFISPRKAGASARSVPLSGRYIVPAYGNAHTHLTWPTDEASKRFLASGVFYAWNPTIGADLAKEKSYFARPGTYDVAIALGGITERGGHPEKLISQLAMLPPEKLVGDAFHYAETPADVDAALDLLVSQGADFVKAYLLFSEEYAERRSAAKPSLRGLNPDLAPYIVKAAKKRGLKTTFHTETMHDLRTAIGSGAMAVMHMPAYNFTFNDSAPEKWALTEGDAKNAARSGLKMVTTYAMMKGWDGKLDRGELEQKQRAVQAQNLRLLVNQGATILIGTDRDGEIFSEAEHLAGLGALQPEELLGIVLATGKHLFPDRRIGCFDAGCEADFLVLRNDPLADIKALRSIDMRIMAGTVVE